MTEQTTNEKVSKKKGCLGCLLAIVIILIAMGLIGSCASDKTTIPKQQTKTSVAQKTEPAEKPIYNIGYTPEQFRAKWNEANQTLNSGLPMTSLPVKTGEMQNSAQFNFSPNISLLCMVNKKDNTVREATLIAVPSQNKIDNLNIIMAFGVLISTTSPELNAEQRGQLLKDLGLIGGNQDLTKLDKTATRGDKKYSIKFLTSMGFVFNVNNVNDKG